MRSSKSRSRSKSNRQRTTLGNIINRVFDSSGPEGKVRGTPQQIIDKYLMLARDAQLSNDRVAEQAFLQHAEHYTRLLGEAQREMAREQEARQGQGGNGNGNGNGNQGGERHEGGRDRYDNRPQRDDEDEQPDFAPLGVVRGDDEGPGLVETPEMYHAPQPPLADGGGADGAPRPPQGERSGNRRSGGGNRPERGGDRPERPAGERPERSGGDRPDRAAGGERAERPAGERPERSGGDRPAGDRPERPAGDRPAGDRPERGPRGPRGPRRPKEERAADGEGSGSPEPAAQAPASSDSE